jgi:hypothetical protein
MMHRACIAVLLSMSTAASAGVIANIRLSRSVPEMVAEYSWAEPKVNTGTSSGPASTSKTVLWESSVIFTQLAATTVEALQIGGAMPARIPAGTLLTGWRLADGTRAFCTGAAEAASAPGKADLAACITYRRDGNTAYFQRVLVRDKGKKLATATNSPLVQQPRLKLGYDDADNIKARPWPGPALFFSYKQISDKGALTREPSIAGSGMAVGQYMIGDRIVLGAVKGNSVTLEHRSFELADFVSPLSAQKDSGYKEVSVAVDLSKGPQTVALGGATFLVSRSADGKVAVETKVPIGRKWSIDQATGRIMLDGRPFVMGAQEI